VRRPFVVLWLATLFFFLGFQMLLPVMPLYAAWLGAREADVGFIIGVFALAAMVLRPLAGDLADRIGRRPLVLLGTAIFALAPLGYLAIGTVPGLLLLRAFHGMGMGFGPTAATVIATDLTAPERRGAAMGVYGLASAAALAVGPYLGAELVRGAGFSVTFLAATAIEIAALALAWNLPETRPVTDSPPPAAPASQAAASSAGSLARFWRRWFSPAAIYPSGLVLALYVSYGGIATLLPLFAEQRQLGNPGLFFTVFALMSLAVRSSAGRLSDRFGRRTVIAPALALSGVSLALLGMAFSRGMFLGAAGLYGVGFGAGQPALLAMTGDRVPPAERGRAMGTLYTAWELGIFGGSVLLGFCATRLGYETTWWTAAAIAGIGAIAALCPGSRLRGEEARRSGR
jgi:MFS family permease